MVEENTWLRKTAWNKRDEYYTPPILVNAILPYVPEGSAVWCPFDTDESEFVIALRRKGFVVIASHIWTGTDFFSCQVPACDCIISNPPYTRKLEVFERLYKIEKPFAMVMGLPILNYQQVGTFFLDKDLQLLIVDKKVSFDGNTASFNNSYFCYRMLPRDIIFAHLEHNNSKGHFVESRMATSKPGKAV